MDTFAEFIEDKCEVGRWLFSTPADLHKAYTEWAELVGERHLSLKKLGSKLRTRGYEQGKDNKSNRIWRGIRPKGAGGTDPSGDPSEGKKSTKSQENAPAAPPWPEPSGQIEANFYKGSYIDPHVENFIKNESDLSGVSEHGGAAQELQEDIEFSGIYVTDEKSAQQLREELGI
jgi:hypothetical protein